MTDTSGPGTALGARLKLLQPGVQLRISDLTDALGGYAATVVEREGHLVWISLPIRRDGMLSLSEGQLVSARFDRPGDAVYLFDSVVSAVRADDDAPYGLAEPVTITRRGHRADVRLSLVLEATFEHQGERSVAKVVDLSAGGLGLISGRPLEVGERISVTIDLPGPDGVIHLERDVEVRTVQVYGRTPSGGTLSQYGLRFSQHNSAEREKILSAVIWNLTRNPDVV